MLGSILLGVCILVAVVLVTLAAVMRSRRESQYPDQIIESGPGLARTYTSTRQPCDLNTSVSNEYHISDISDVVISIDDDDRECGTTVSDDDEDNNDNCSSVHYGINDEANYAGYKYNQVMQSDTFGAADNDLVQIRTFYSESCVDDNSQQTLNRSNDVVLNGVNVLSDTSTSSNQIQNSPLRLLDNVIEKNSNPVIQNIEKKSFKISSTTSRGGGVPNIQSSQVSDLVPSISKTRGINYYYGTNISTYSSNERTQDCVINDSTNPLFSGDSHGASCFGGDSDCINNVNRPFISTSQSEVSSSLNITSTDDFFSPVNTTVGSPSVTFELRNPNSSITSAEKIGMCFMYA